MTIEELYNFICSDDLIEDFPVELDWWDLN